MIPIFFISDIHPFLYVNDLFYGVLRVAPQMKTKKGSSCLSHKTAQTDDIAARVLLQALFFPFPSCFPRDPSVTGSLYFHRHYDTIIIP